MEQLSKEEFCARFKARMLECCKNIQPNNNPEGFQSLDEVAAYADQTAPTYWEDQHKDGESPEDCADADISYWGE